MRPEPHSGMSPLSTSIKVLLGNFFRDTKHVGPKTAFHGELMSWNLPSLECKKT